MNLYIGKADWKWVEPHLGGKWSKTGQRQGEESPIGALLFKPRRHTHPYTHTYLWLLADHFSWPWPLPKKKSNLTAHMLTSKERSLFLPELKADPRWRVKLLTSGCRESKLQPTNTRKEWRPRSLLVLWARLRIVLYPVSSRKNRFAWLSYFFFPEWHLALKSELKYLFPCEAFTKSLRHTGRVLHLSVLSLLPLNYIAAQPQCLAYDQNTVGTP